MEAGLFVGMCLLFKLREAAAVAGSPLQRMTNWRLILLNECSCWDNSLTCYLTLAIFHDKTRVDICLPVCSTDVCILGALHTIHFEEILSQIQLDFLGTPFFLLLFLFRSEFS